MKIVWENTACTLSADPQMRVHSELPCSLEPDTLRYAACRVFQKVPRLRRETARLSWQLRLARGSARRGVRGSYLLPAAWLGLPGAWARVCILVDPQGVTVRRLELLRDKPAILPRRRDG